ncbi:MAG TPA: hypothetical protein VNS57_02865 [Steroidobacteraceae bacterium]|nr:hypothetical protein [Steroidobacteraceae bacterium]
MRRAHTLDIDRPLGLKAEHICLESEEPVVAERPSAVRLGPTFKFASPLRGCDTELTFSTDHRLRVRMRRPRQPLRTYAVDLRFVDTTAVARHRIAWRGWQMAALLAAFGALAYGLTRSLADPQWQATGLQAAIAFATAALWPGLVALHRTRTIVELCRVHGDARLAEIIGSLGGARDAQPFVDELVRRVEVARTAVTQTKQQFLRDEMREHYRLWNEGVLSDSVYEASKRRILEAHD